MALDILHISESDAAGGAARTAYRLHSGLKALGHGSRMLVGRRVTSDADVRPLKRTRGWRALDRLAGAPLDRLSLQYLFYPSSFAVAADPWFRAADIVQIHNTHGSYFSHSALPLLTRMRPAVWMLQDMWAFTGHVGYAHDCERWLVGCGSCPYLHEYPALRRDTSAALWRYKRRVYDASRLTIVAPSRWLADLIERSPLLGRFPVHRIPHGLDTATFCPGPQADARRRLGVPEERLVVLFAAADLGEARKGFALLDRAVASLPERPLVVLAGGGRVDPTVETLSLGSLADDGLLADAYRAADVLAVPTLADTFPQTALEAVACGTPCVSFDRGGVVDIVRDGETGLHARYGDVDDLGRALAALLGDAHLRERLASRCRQAVGEFSVELQARRYVSLYDEVRAARRRSRAGDALV